MRRITGWRSVSTIATACAVIGAALSVVVPHLRAPAPERLAARSFPNVPLLTQDGTVVRFYDDLLKGKAVAIDLIYTTCTDECPLETARLAQVQRLLKDHVGKDLFFYSISIDPLHDTPEALKAYADKFHAGPGWLFLTGKEGDIQQIAKKLGMSYSKAALTSQDSHATTLMLGDEPTGQWMLNSAEDNPRFLASTIGTFMGWPSDAPQPSYAEAKPLEIDRGGYVFRSRCVGCHTIGQGDVVGPDLAGVTDRRDGAWLARYLAAPDQVLAAGDPIATALYAKYHEVPMPNLKLGSDDVGALVSYLDAQSRPAGVANAPATLARP